MASAVFYVDESGDLGWTFTAPYNKGGSSRYLTIATLTCPSKKKHLPKRLVKKLYERFKWDSKREKKWSEMRGHEKRAYAAAALDLLGKHPDIKLIAITVSKENVAERMRKDSNNLYNYMLRLSVIDEMIQYDEVILVPDPRTIKVKSGNSMHDYLNTCIVFEKEAKTILHTQPCDSAGSMNLQFVDMLAGLIQNHFEDSNSECWYILKDKISFGTLFFPSVKPTNAVTAPCATPALSEAALGMEAALAEEVNLSSGDGMASPA